MRNDEPGEPSLDMEQEVAMMIKRRFSFKKQHLNLNLCQHYWKQIILSRDFATVNQLTLEGNAINDEDIITVSDLRLPCLRIISLRNNKITDSGLKAILSSQKETLKSLDMGDNEIIYEEPALFDLRMGCLQVLNIKEGMVGFLDCKRNYETLTRLSLEDNNIGSRGVKYLTKADLPALANLNISKCNIGDEGLLHLLKGKWPIQKLCIGKQHFSISSYKQMYTRKWQMVQTLSLTTEHVASGVYCMLCKSTTEVQICSNIKNENFKSHIKLISASLLSK